MHEKNRGFKLLSTDSTSEVKEVKAVKKKRSFLETLRGNNKNISEGTIKEACNLASSKEISSQDYNTLVVKIRSVRMWVRSNHEYLDKIDSSLDKFNEIAEDAKGHKEHIQPLISMGMFFGPEVEKGIHLYKAAVKKEIEIASRLYDYLHKPSTTDINENPFSDKNAIDNENKII